MRLSINKKSKFRGPHLKLLLSPFQCLHLHLFTLLLLLLLLLLLEERAVEARAASNKPVPLLSLLFLHKTASDHSVALHLLSHSVAFKGIIRVQFCCSDILFP